MAIEIKRTPVLQGNASEAFLQSIKGNQPTPVSNEKVRDAVQLSKQIMEEFKAKGK